MEQVVLEGQAGGHCRQDLRILPSLVQMSPNHLPSKVWAQAKDVMASKAQAKILRTRFVETPKVHILAHFMPR